MKMNSLTAICPQTSKHIETQTEKYYKARGVKLITHKQHIIASKNNTNVCTKE